MRRWVAILLLGVGCGGEKSREDFGTVTGRLRVFLSTDQRALEVPAQRRPQKPELDPASRAGILNAEVPSPLLIPARERFVAGELLVAFDQEPSDTKDAVKRAYLPAFQAAHGGFAGAGVHLIRYRNVAGSAVDEETTRKLQADLSHRSGVRWVALNRWNVPTAVPDDRFFSAQWHFPAINLPPAWDVATGSVPAVVAVVDTGILPHPDLTPHVLQGVDVISDPSNADDGNGRDMDPTDQGGDLSGGRSSFHGSHVSGTVGALTNNEEGVSGVSWDARILPVRALGRNGGTTADVIAGISWAIGDEVPGLERNSNPAQVINLSLGTTGSPDPAYQDVIDRGVGRGVIFVVAAGNESADTADKIPCNQQNVICVGGARLDGTRASYSNFGPQVDVMAPGGEGLEDQNGDDFPDAILSTYFDESRTPAYAFLQGTSMATPHVSGVVSLMKTLDPGLNHERVEQLLRETASGALGCSEGCGAGLINAQTALVRASGQSGLSGPAALFVPSPHLVLFEAAPTRVVIANAGGTDLDLTGVFSSKTEGLTVDFPEGGQLHLASGEVKSVLLVAFAPGLAAGEFDGKVAFTSGGDEAGSVSVEIRVGAPNGAQTALVSLMTMEKNGKWNVAVTGPALPENEYAWSIGVAPGTYYVAAGIDDNGNGDFFDEGERSGFFPTRDEPVPIHVAPGATVDGIDFVLLPLD